MKLSLRIFFLVAIIILLTGVSLFFVQKQGADDGALQLVTYSLGAVPVVIATIWASRKAGNYAKKRRTFFAYVMSLIGSSILGAFCGLMFYLLVLIETGQLGLLATFFRQNRWDTYYFAYSVDVLLFVTVALGVGGAIFITAATWIKRNPD